MPPFFWAANKTDSLKGMIYDHEYYIVERGGKGGGEKGGGERMEGEGKEGEGKEVRG